MSESRHVGKNVYCTLKVKIRWYEPTFIIINVVNKWWKPGSEMCTSIVQI